LLRPFRSLSPPFAPFCKLLQAIRDNNAMQDARFVSTASGMIGLGEVPRENDWAMPELSLQPPASDMNGVAGGVR
ncbi:MAG: hypothetical protein Q9196_007126, partial [Gyalolechia fulgens]